ncbi:MAG: DegT/DnrJ/EryC1/StrS family aminotransferase [Planctomycetes bacterium]|nr:DegT/DnrJ/EryC1/StrS family aminotransferase [Planctomycetota bacterium]
MMQWRVPLFEPDFGPIEMEAVMQPLRDQWITMGETTARLEAKFAERCGVKHAIAINNCTAALHLAMIGAGVGPGDEVIVPTLTFVATANAVRYVGAEPVFCDSAGPHNLNIDVEQITERITPRTKAVIVVHYAGFPVNMPRVLEIARTHGLVVVEDCAHALFSTLQGRACGSWGVLGCFSFFGNKNITCGEGGMLTTNDDDLAARMKNMRSHGMTTVTLDRFKGRAFSYDVIAHGYNYRMEDLRSAVALAQLGRLDGFLAERQRVRDRYQELLAGSPVTVPDFDWERIRAPQDRMGHHIMPVLLPSGVDRAKITDRLKEAGVQSSFHYPPVHRFTAFAGCSLGRGSLARTEALAARELTLPMFPTLTNEQVGLVCGALLEAVERATA